MMNRAFHHISGRLSLRPPQAESLSKLARALDAAPGLLSHERDVSAILSTLKAEFTTLEDFERGFPSLCFALATGVGQVSRGFTALKPCNYTATVGQTAHHFRETVTETSRIKQMLFGGFARCLYPLQKFDSDTERRFAIILERDASKWLKPAKGQFQIYYKFGAEQPEYIPDFVAETDSTILMVETKARTDLDTEETQAKATAAASWCQHASEYATEVGAKPWKYLLAPHDEIVESKRLSDFLRFEVKAI